VTQRVVLMVFMGNNEDCNSLENKRGRYITERIFELKKERAST